MARAYQPREIESRHYERWEEAGYFRAAGSGPPFSIMIPPPNVTGTLHMGHAFNETIMDALIRFHRMRGDNTLWQPGTDHAGIATQMVVERLLGAEGKSKHDLGRDAFLERVWEWKEHSGSRITQQLRRLGSSLDWSRERFTMDEDLSRAVVEVFVRLHDEGLIYRGKRLVNWDPVLHTALSDLEVLSGEEQGKLWRFRYPLTDGDGYLVVATTRPETMLGDTAVAVHPEDPRYASLIGKSVRLPLADRDIPIIADEYVDPEFGTGCVKITPGHDFNDFEVGRRHDLPVINIFGPDATLNDAVPEVYRNLERFDARERVVADLESAGLLDGIDAHTLMVPRGDRSGAIVEPLLTDQWYVRAEPLATPAIAAVEDGRIRFVPENWSKTYFEWMRNIEDWCISRQLWWGHRIPAWYDESGNVYVARNEDEVRAKHGLGADVTLRQDDDVLDTWFSSALWPFSTLGWPENTEELDTFYPTAVLVTAFDIIFFWVARMVMMGLKFMGDVPFRVVYIHGLVRDHEGQKMSKSKGNVLDPIDLIDGIDLETLLRQRTEGMMQPHLKAKVEKATKRDFPDGIQAYGTDALRMTMASLATTGRDINFDLGRIEGYRNFCNKLWNAAHYVFTNIDGALAGEPELGVADRWIRSRLSETIATVEESVAGYRLDLAAQALYEFTWHELCDWYLELTKPVLNDAAADTATQLGARQTLRDTLGALLRLLHPIMPFVTEELWLELCKHTGRSSATVMLEPLPSVDEYSRDHEAEEEIAWLKDFVIGVRQIRGEMNISPGKRLPVLLADVGPSDRERLDRHRSLLQSLARLDRIDILEGTEPDGIATALVRQFRILVPLADLIDIEAERARLGKQRQRIEQDLAKAESKLGNDRFVTNAPEAVVQKERDRAADLTNQLKSLEQQLARL
ncbi:MAG: valine--tRNA ligase [Gammaproteobacteria bacterium]|nr:valine--tRNA ligase [Gammaproteobacteria bacterium]MDH3507374.1 valine--tRNA ligase [Gammaproteobacteria bacterium]